MNTANKIKKQLTGFWENKPIKRAYLFGSVAREEFTNDSDIDILVELDNSKIIGMIEYIKIIDALEDILKKKIDLITTDGLSPYLKPSIDKDKLLIYESKFRG